jgi:hypothetical protein
MCLLLVCDLIGDYKNLTTDTFNSSFEPINYESLIGFSYIDKDSNIYMSRGSTLYKISINDLESGDLHHQKLKFPKDIKTAIVYDTKNLMSIVFVESDSGVFSYRVDLKKWKIWKSYRLPFGISTDFAFQLRDGVFIGERFGRGIFFNPSGKRSAAAFIILILIVAAILIVIGIPVCIINRRRKRELVIKDMRDRLLEYQRPIDPNSAFLSNPFKNSYIIPFRKLRILQRIAEGASGVVYAGKWNRTKVAIKVFIYFFTTLF